MDQIILKDTSSSAIFSYNNSASFKKTVSSLGEGESLVSSVSRVPRQTVGLEDGDRGLGNKEDHLSVDRFIIASAFREKANGTSGVRGTDKRRERLVFLPIPAPVSGPPVHSVLYLHS